MAMRIARRFRGPSSSGNGGYVAALVAAAVGAEPVTVTLRVPPPLEVPLDILTDDDGARLVHGETVVAEGVAAGGDELEAVPSIEADAARRAAQTYPGFQTHPFPECFVCGPQRAAGDGLRLFPGRLGDGRTACTWTVGADLAGEPRFVWAALDCPGGWSAPIEGRPMVLGRMTARVSSTPTAGEECVVMGRLEGSEGRKTWTATTVYGDDGRELGRARATWITVATPSA